MNPYQPPAPSQPAAEVPDDVRTARQLWWGVTAFGLVWLVARTIGWFGNRHTIAQNMYDQMHTRQPEATLDQVGLVVVLLLIVLVLFGLGLTVGAVAVVHQIHRGRVWARTLGDVATMILIVTAIGTMLRLGSVSGPPALIGGAALILQAVLAAGAAFLCHRGDSEAYFRRTVSR